MIIKNSRFLVSNQSAQKCPPPIKPEFAFIGRSNVGKSSLINMLCQSKSLAKTSSTPGKTQLINHFLINETWFLVDLPGYGYAKTSKVKKETFSKIIQDYIENRSNLMCLFVLVDSRLDPQANDLEFINQLEQSDMHYAIVFTKNDKLGKVKSSTQLEAYKQRLLELWGNLPPIFISSATNKEGREEILTFIEETIAQWKPNQEKPNKREGMLNK